jgi:putative chitinase
VILTADQLKAMVPAIKQGAIDAYLPHLNAFLPKYDINSPPRIGGFVAQVAHESANFSAVREYASGKEYEGRADLGNTSEGDGVRFKGRGLIQITGKGNYKWCSRDLFGDDRLLTTPDLLTTPQYAVQSACWFWKVAKPMNAICDHSEDWTHEWGNPVKGFTKIMWMTLLVNGGQNGLAERMANYDRARRVLIF